MSRFRRALLPLLPLLVGAAPPAPAPDEAAAAERVRADVAFLAGDGLTGREPGQPGHSAAAQYVAGRFAAIGLKPGGTNGDWFLQVPFRRATHAVVPKLRLLVGRRPTELVNGSDFAVRPSLTQSRRRIDAPLVFAGHGISEPRVGIDEYAGLDVRGKIVVVLDGTPKGLPTDVAAHLDSWKDRVAGAKGAAGIIEVGGRFDRVRAYADRPIIDWVDAQGRAGSQPVAARIYLSGRVAERLFAGASRSLAQVSAAADEPLAGFPLAARLSLDSSSAWSGFTSPEVIGVLPGTDPRLAAERIVLMGHLDHLGTKTNAKPGEDAILNGALDNAAGVATMIEAARSFIASGKPPRRTVMFIANTGEERGLLGADYFAAHPTVPLQSIVGAVDLDMPVLLYDFTDVTAFGGDHSTVARSVADAARSMNLAVSPDPMPEESLFVRSDHYRFVTRGIPAILLMTGYANGGKAQWQRYLSTIYHSPKDDLAQPINWRAGARYAELNYRIARTLADQDQRPMWYGGDYFGETFAPGQPRAERSGP